MAVGELKKLGRGLTRSWGVTAAPRARHPGSWLQDVVGASVSLGSECLVYPGYLLPSPADSQGLTPSCPPHCGAVVLRKLTPRATVCGVLAIAQEMSGGVNSLRPPLPMA